MVSIKPLPSFAFRVVDIQIIGSLRSDNHEGHIRATSVLSFSNRISLKYEIFHHKFNIDLWVVVKPSPQWGTAD